MNREELLEQLLFRREAEELTGLSKQAFQYHVDKRNIIPAKQHGKGKGKVQLFWRDEVEGIKSGNYVK